MKIKVLEYFVVLAESSSINEAAQRLYVAQPSLTKSLQQFENEIGTQLFYRSKSGITLTEAGKKVLPEAKKVLEYYNGWLNLAQSNTLQAMDIYAHSSLSGFLVPDIILRFRERYPDLKINYVTTPTPDAYISDDVQKPAVVLALCRHGDPLEKLVKRQGNQPVRLLEGEFVCLMNRDNALADKDRISVEELKDCYYAIPRIDSFTSEESVISPILNRVIDQISIRKVIPVESVSNVIELIQRRPNIFTLSYYPVLNRYSGVMSNELIYTPFVGQETQFDLCLFYSKMAYQQYPPMRELIGILRQELDVFLEDVDYMPLSEI